MDADPDNDDESQRGKGRVDAVEVEETDEGALQPPVSASSIKDSMVETCDDDALSSSTAAKTAKPGPTKKKQKRRKPKDMPKRPLSAYNLFFADERRRLLQQGGIRIGVQGMQNSMSDSELTAGATSSQKRLGFAGLARTVAAKWKTIDPVLKARFEEMAATEQIRYKKQIHEYNEKRTQGGGASKGSSFVSLTSSSSNIGNGNRGSQDPPPVWPAMPQTIANLGNIYADPSLSSSQRTSVAGMNAAGARIDCLAHPNLLVNPTGTFNMAPATYGSTMSTVPVNPEMGFPYPNAMVYPPSINPHQKQNPIISWGSEPTPMASPKNDHPSDSFKQQPASSRPRRPSWLSRRLSDLEGIQRLAAELDDDQLEVLSTLKGPPR